MSQSQSRYREGAEILVKLSTWAFSSSGIIAFLLLVGWLASLFGIHTYLYDDGVVLICYAIVCVLLGFIIAVCFNKYSLYKDPNYLSTTPRWPAIIGISSWIIVFLISLTFPGGLWWVIVFAFVGYIVFSESDEHIQKKFKRE